MPWPAWLQIVLAGVTGNEDTTDRWTEKLRWGGPCSLMETHQHPGNSVCLLSTAEGGGRLANTGRVSLQGEEPQATVVREVATVVHTFCAYCRHLHIDQGKALPCSHVCPWCSLLSPARIHSELHSPHLSVSCFLNFPDAAQLLTQQEFCVVSRMD